MKSSTRPVSRFFFAIGAGALTFFAWRRAQAPSMHRISEFDDRLRRALKEEDRNSTPFPKEVDLEPGFE